MKYIKLIQQKSTINDYVGPFSVLYHIQDVYSNTQSNFKLKYSGILLKEEAIQKADSLFNSLVGYYKKHLNKLNYKIEVIVSDNNKNQIYITKTN